MTKVLYSLNNYSLSLKTPEPGDIKDQVVGSNKLLHSLSIKHSKCQRFARVQESPRQTHSHHRQRHQRSLRKLQRGREHTRGKAWLCAHPSGHSSRTSRDRSCWSQDTKLDGPLLPPRTFIHLSEVSEEPCLQNSSLGGRWCLAGINVCGC